MVTAHPLKALERTAGVCAWHRHIRGRDALPVALPCDPGGCGCCAQDLGENMQQLVDDFQAAVRLTSPPSSHPLRPTHVLAGSARGIPGYSQGAWDVGIQDVG